MESISFSLKFPTVELAKRFVVRVVHFQGVPCLRNELTVHVIVTDRSQAIEVISIAREMGAEGL